MQAVKNSDQTAARTAQGAQSMFLQGERTDEKQIPKDGNVVYLGSWYGYIANGTSWTGNASNETSGNRAEFTVNFDKKQITGKLTAENRSEATFTIDAMIEGNGFKGTAKTGNDGFAPDQNSSTGTYKVHIANAEVRGGFTRLTPKSWADGLPIRAMNKRKCASFIRHWKFSRQRDRGIRCEKPRACEISTAAEQSRIRLQTASFLPIPSESEG